MNRLSSTALIQNLDKGHRSLPWRRPDLAHTQVSVNLAEILQSADAERKIQGLPAQALYLAIKTEGISEIAEAVRLMSAEQFVRMLDYDSWLQDELSPSLAFQWLNALEVYGEGSMAQRYRELDEEYQIALLEKFVRCCDLEQYEAMGNDEQDLYYAMPGAELFYCIITDQKDIQESIHRLIESAMDFNMNYAISLLAHAHGSVPNEPELLLSQFRRARLEEDGFVSFEESQNSFAPIDFVRIKDAYFQNHSDKQQETLVVSQQVSPGISFLDRVVAAAEQQSHRSWDDFLAQKFAYLANSLCTASNVDPCDSESIKDILFQARALASIGLEFLADKNETIGVDILSKEHPKTLFRVGMSLIYLIQNQTLSVLESKGFKVEKLRRYKANRKFGNLLLKLDTEFLALLGFELNEVLKGLFNRYPMRPDQLQDDSRQIKTIYADLPVSTTSHKRIYFRAFKSIEDIDDFNVILESQLNQLSSLQ